MINTEEKTVAAQDNIICILVLILLLLSHFESNILTCIKSISTLWCQSQIGVTVVYLLNREVTDDHADLTALVSVAAAHHRAHCVVHHGN